MWSLILKGMAIGMLVSAPMGPVGVLTVQRTLNKGRWFGFATGVGAVVSDLFYAFITGLGMSFVTDVVTHENNRFWLTIVGSALLLCFGIYTYRSRPQASVHAPSGRKGTLWSNAVTGFMLTFINPLIVFLFIALFAQMTFVMHEGAWLEWGLGYAAIGGGALLWWFILTAGLERLRAKSDVSRIWKLNRFIGVIVVIASVIVLLYALNQL